MRPLGFLVTVAGIIGCLVYFTNLTSSYDPLVGDLHDRVNGIPGASRMRDEDQRSHNLLWLGVWAVVAVGGVVIARSDGTRG